MLAYNNCAPSFQATGDGSSAFKSNSGSLSDEPAFVGPMDDFAGGSQQKSILNTLSDGFKCNSVTKGQVLQVLNYNVGPLTHRQYEYTVNNLFGITVYPDLINDYSKVSYNNSLGRVAPGIELVEGFFSSAEKVLSAIKSTAAANSRVFKCSNPNNENECLSEFTENWGRLLFRRPLSSNESQKVLDVAFDQGGSLNNKMESALYLLLVSPQFTYHFYGLNLAVNNSDTQQIDEYDFASKISFFLWGQAPEGWLLDLAENNQLRQQLPEVVDRMLASEKSTYVARELAYNWFTMGSLREVGNKNFGVDGVTNDQANWNLAEQVTHFVDYHIQNNLPVSDLFNTDVMFHTDKTAKLYGLNSNGYNGQFKMVKTGDPNRSSGILSHMGFWANNSSNGEVNVFTRGPMIKTKLLCDVPIGAPSGQLIGTSLGESDTIKASVNKLSQVAPCSSCHIVTDPYGKAVENFDSFGRYRANYSNGEAINYTQLTPEGVSISSVKDLGVHFARDKKDLLNYCATKNLLSLASGKDLFDDRHIGALNSVGSCYTLQFYGQNISQNQDIKMKDLIKKIIIAGSSLIGQTAKVSE